MGKLSATVLSVLFLSMSVFGQPITWDYTEVRSGLTRPLGIDSNDIDGNGFQDIVVIDDDPVDGIYIYYQQAGNVWDEYLLAQNISSGRYVHAGDIDGDGDCDVVCTSVYTGLEWWEQSGPNTWNRYMIDAGYDYRGLLVVDLDADGYVDIIATDPSESGGVMVYRQTGFNTWDPILVDDDHWGVLDIDYGDYDNDGDLDIAVVADHTPGIAYYLQNGITNWTEYNIPHSGSLARQVASCDINEDGLLDFAVGDGYGGMYWYEQTSIGNYVSNAVDDGSFECHHLVPQDLDNDGDLDIIATSHVENEISWWEQVDPYTWTRWFIDDFTLADQFRVTDFNNDGYFDLAATSNFAGNVGLWLHRGSDLVAHWNCDEGSGSTLHNATGSHLNGTLFDGATWSTSGHENGSLDIPGYTAGVIVPDHPDLDITDEIVLDFWFNPRTYAGEWPRIMIGKQHAVSDWCYAVYWGEDNYSDGIVFSIGNGSGGASIHYQESIDLDVWHHLAASYDGAEMRLIIDDQVVGTRVTSEAIGTSDYDLRIGSHFSGPNRSFDGLLDEIKIFRSTEEPPPDDPVTLTLIPHNTQIPSNGGTLTYDVHIVSLLPDRYANVYYWTNIILPNGNAYPPGGWLISLHANLPPFADIYRTGFTQNIPSYAQSGDYEFQAHFGYPNSQFVSDSFLFTKQHGISTGIDVIDWNAGGSLGLDDLELSDPLPTEWAVAAAWPNPFNPSTTIRVALPEAAELTVTVTNILGQQVAVLANDVHEAGNHVLAFDGYGLASGLYFIHARVPGHLNQVQKVMLVR